jgi:hypothetical protein
LIPVKLQPAPPSAENARDFDLSRHQIGKPRCRIAR